MEAKPDTNNIRADHLRAFYHRYNGHSIQQVAELMNASPTTVKRLIGDACAELGIEDRNCGITILDQNKMYELFDEGMSAAGVIRIFRHISRHQILELHSVWRASTQAKREERPPRRALEVVDMLEQGFTNSQILYNLGLSSNSINRLYVLIGLAGERGRQALQKRRSQAKLNKMMAS